MNKKLIPLLLGLVLLPAVGLFVSSRMAEPPAAFDGQRAYQHVLRQVEMGPRTPGSPAHTEVIEYILSTLEGLGWQAQVVEDVYAGQVVKNIYAIRPGQSPIILFAAHYDSRFFADNDPDPANHSLPVTGANDGASGVAVLLELARVLPAEGQPVGLLFTDAEDNGNIPGWDWILGANAFARSMTFEPEAVVILDMIGDADLNIYQEHFSDDALTASIWAQAAALGYEQYFIPETRFSIIDDHIPFLNRGLRAITVIDFDYPYWHTVEDTADKVSPDSLQIVGHTMLEWVRNYQPGMLERE